MTVDGIAPFFLELQSPESDTPTVVVSGEVDMLTAPELAEFIDDLIGNNNPHSLMLDLTDMTFMDARGAGVIASARARLPDECGVILRHPKPIVRRVLEICELDGPCIIED